MPVLYRYTAKNMEGKSVRGTAEAEDYDALYAQLLGQGLYLQSASKGFGGGGKTLKIGRASGRERVYAKV